MRLPQLLLCLPLLISLTAHAADLPASGPPDPKARPAAWEPADPQDKIERGALLRPGSEVPRPGQLLRFDLYVRNPTDKAVEGTFSTERPVCTPPVVEDGEGRVVKVVSPTVRMLGTWALVRYRLEPGETRFVGSATLTFDPQFAQDGTGERGRLHCVAVAGAGKYTVTYPGAAPVTVEIK